MKVRVNISIDKEVYEKAHELGINVSKACENCLKQYIAAIESVRLTNGGKSFLGEASFTKEGSMDGAGFEPATSTMPTWRSFQADLPAQPHSN